jgi:hypothetical protein
MLTESHLVDYFRYHFTDLICEDTDRFLAVEMLCGSSGRSVSGYPEIVFLLVDNREVSFTSSEYMIYPSHTESTMPIRGMFGLICGD